MIDLLADQGITVEQRKLEIDEVIEGARSGELSEAFGAGTAAIIAPVGRMAYQGDEVTINDNQAGEMTRALYDTITGIQMGEVEDKHDWTRIVDVENTNLGA